jgi:hypothetical protein
MLLHQGRKSSIATGSCESTIAIQLQENPPTKRQEIVSSIIRATREEATGNYKDCRGEPGGYNRKLRQFP